MVLGMGLGLMAMTSLVVIHHYFNKKRAMASSIAASGSGVGVLLFSILINYLLIKTNWRWSLRVYSGIASLCSLCSLAFRPLQKISIDEEENVSRNNEYGTFMLSNKNEEEIGCFRQFISERFPEELLERSIFYMMCLLTCCFTMGYNIPLQYLPERSEYLGISKSDSSFHITVIGIATVVSRASCGCIGKYIS